MKREVALRVYSSTVGEEGWQREFRLFFLCRYMDLDLDLDLDLVCGGSLFMIIKICRSLSRCAETT